MHEGEIQESLCNCLPLDLTHSPLPYFQAVSAAVPPDQLRVALSAASRGAKAGMAAAAVEAAVEAAAVETTEGVALAMADASDAAQDSDAPADVWEAEVPERAEGDAGKPVGEVLVMADEEEGKKAEPYIHPPGESHVALGRDHG